MKPNSSELLCIYKSIARRLTKAVRWRLYRRFPPHPQFNAAKHEARQRDKLNIALHMWRIFWEGLEPWEGRVVLTRPAYAGERWRTFVFTRFRELFPGAKVHDTSSWARWSDNHLFASACCGTFVECLRRAGEVECTREAGVPAASLTGESIPFCVSEPAGEISGERVLHLWRPKEFDQLETFLR